MTAAAPHATTPAPPCLPRCSRARLAVSARGSKAFAARLRQRAATATGSHATGRHCIQRTMVSTVLMRGFSANLEGNAARHVGQLFLPCAYQRLKQPRQKLCWHGPCGVGADGWGHACEGWGQGQAARAPCARARGACICERVPRRGDDEASPAPCHASVACVAPYTGDLCLHNPFATAAAAEPRLELFPRTVIGRSHRLKQMAHFSVSSSSVASSSLVSVFAWALRLVSAARSAQARSNSELKPPCCPSAALRAIHIAPLTLS